ncbi:MAG: hypothetical protein QOG10_2760 [Kribbellaceae bacterium]|nr:hypothetical protein [Kribbellaceae bacterium]
MLVRILLVEDEQPLAKYVATGLRKHGYAVDIAFDGRTALEKCELTPDDVVVRDRESPDAARGGGLPATG